MMEQESPNTENLLPALPSPDVGNISVEGDNLVTIVKPVPLAEEPVYIGVNNMADDYTRDFFDIRGDIKDSRFDVASRIAESKDSLSKQVDAIDDTLTAALNVISRDTQDVRAQLTAVGYQVRDGFAAASKDSEINGLKTQIEIAKQTTYLSDKIDNGHQRLSDQMNALHDSDQTRMLVERNTELVAALADGRHWRHWGDWRDSQGQWQALNSQLQAFQSQLQETRQGMVNFGTMAGVGQTSTSNNVR